MPDSWNTPKKLGARKATIIAPWEKQTGLAAIPVGSQYWTICGPMTDAIGDLQTGCELEHLLSAKLIQSEQFHGVERDVEVQASNLFAVTKAFPEPSSRPHLYTGDLVWAMDDAARHGKLHPAIVNIDTASCPRFGGNLLGKVLAILNCIPGRVMVTWNIVIESRYKGPKRNFEDQLLHLGNDALLRSTFQSGGWKALGSYRYAGTSIRSTTTMKSFVLWRDAPRKRKAA